MKDDSSPYPERNTARGVQIRELGKSSPDSGKKEIPNVERMPREAPGSGQGQG
jgi:hypothetical protein